MRISIIVPDELIADMKVEADNQHMNRTQYIVRACTQMVSADKTLRLDPEIKAKMNELSDMLSSIGKSYS